VQVGLDNTRGLLPLPTAEAAAGSSTTRRPAVALSLIDYYAARATHIESRNGPFTDADRDLNLQQFARRYEVSVLRMLAELCFLLSPILAYLRPHTLDSLPLR